MSNKDLQIAKRYIEEGRFSVVAVKDGQVIACAEGWGVKPLFEMIESKKNEIKGSAIGDKVMGRAAAFLCLYGEAAAVYAGIISENAEYLLKKAGKQVNYREMVPYILNKERTGMCPMERLTQDLTEAEAAYSRLKDFFAKFKPANK